MNITLNNYEEYFLLLADNELGPAEEALVRQFAAKHPHLQEELQVLFHCRLDAADMPVFPKEMLLRPAIWNIENPEPVYTQMLSLLDNELPLAEKEQLKQQIAASPVLRAEWNTLQKTVLPAEAITYPDKTALYRQRTIRPLAWMRWAAAAAVFAMAWLNWPAKINTSLSSGLVGVLPTLNQNISVPAQLTNTSVTHIHVAQQKTVNTSNAVITVAQQHLTDIVQTKNKSPETTASTKPNSIGKKETDRALFKEEVVAPAPEELAMVEPPIKTLGNDNSLAANLSKNEDMTVQTAQFTPKNSMLSPDVLQSTTAMHINERDEAESYVHIAGARFDKQKVRGLFRGITRSVTRTFSKSKIQPAETAYTTRNL